MSATQCAPDLLPVSPAMGPPPGGLELQPLAASDPTVVADADQRARYWTSDDAGPLQPGTPAHARATARMFRDTFNPYKPTIIDWPKLEPAARDRLISLPIWDIAVQTEGKARIRMLAYAYSLTHPDWRAAVELNGWEEGRHKTVLSNLVAAYGITLEPEPPYPPPKNAHWAYLVTGFSECIDSFFAFGLFAMAQRSGYFPPALVDTFEPVIQEECRHILLFANWLAWHRCNLPAWRRPWFELQVAAAWVFLGWERMGLARSVDEGATVAGAQSGKPQDHNFTLNGSKAVSDVDLSVADLMALCLAENKRRFAGYDKRLLRPTTMPALTRLALAVIRRWPFGKRAAQDRNSRVQT